MSYFESAKQRVVVSYHSQRRYRLADLVRDLHTIEHTPSVQFIKQLGQDLYTEDSVACRPFTRRGRVWHVYPETGDGSIPFCRYTKVVEQDSEQSST